MKLRRFLALILVSVLSCSLVFGESTEASSNIETTTTDWEPYGEGEFPGWAYELRRGETLFFGSLAITFPLVALGCQGLRALGVDAPDDDSIWGVLEQAGIAAGFSFGIAFTDWILGKTGVKNAR